MLRTLREKGYSEIRRSFESTLNLSEPILTICETTIYSKNTNLK